MSTQYLIRNVGWYFNDSTWEYFGDNQVVESYHDRETAEKRLKELNRVWFVDKISWVMRYETWRPHHPKDYASYHADILDFLMQEFGFNPTIKLHPGQIPLSLEMFQKWPSDSQWDMFMEVINVSFFTLTEIRSEEQGNFYAAKCNPDIFGHDDYLMDYHHRYKLVFSNPIELIHILLEDEIEYLTADYSKVLKLGKMGEGLSDMPAILDALIRSENCLEVEEGELLMTWLPDAETFARINSVLKNPMLHFEKVPLAEIPVMEDQKNLLEIVDDFDSTRQYFEGLYEDRLEDGPLERNPEYLNWFTWPIPMHAHPGKSVWAEVVLRELEPEFTSLGFKLSYGNIYWKEHRIELKALILEMETGEQEVHLKVVFGMDTITEKDLENTVECKGAEVKDAVLAGFESWLKTFGKASFRDYQLKNTN